jgi:hypothetical protein
MSDIAMAAAARSDGPFRPKTILIVAAVGILAFVAMLVLGAYAPDLRSGRNGGTHALSNAATGFSGIIRLAQATGRNPLIARSEQMFDTEDLVVLTPETGATQMGHILSRRTTKPTLVVMPKWATLPDPVHSGWVRAGAFRPAWDLEKTLAPDHPMKVERRPGGGRPLRTVPQQAPAELRFVAPGPLQTASGPRTEAILTDEAGRPVLVKAGDGPLYLLTDPDLLSNRGMADRRQAGGCIVVGQDEVAKAVVGQEATSS